MKGEASRFIDTLTCGILAKYSTIAEAFSSPGVSPTFQRESPLLQYYDCESNIPVERGVTGGARELPLRQDKLCIYSANRANSCCLNKPSYFHRGASLSS